MVEGTDIPLRNTSSRDVGKGALHFPWVATTLASVLITTIVVDILGNLLVIISVFRNRKLRKAATFSSGKITLRFEGGTREQFISTARP
ncbi:hypothetical protein AALO_G00268030 [Alosa alosa]|uniref:Melatonin receptor 1a n=1 Tax=Alosa alosa TaxID=278164 RepID=A0AAV6FRJ5_9TELE|nr:hypothetical protein AALO_G00268030 [Alosa alosa]